MAERLLYELLVTDKGSPVLRQFQAETQRTGKHSSQFFQEATQASTRLSGSLSSLVKQSTAVALGFAGYQGIVGTVNAVVDSVVTFDKEMANVNTVIMESGVTVKDLERQLLQLPPSLGTSTELAKGLYQALSAGVPAGQAVAFVAEQAKLAKGGLTDLETTVKVSTAAMDAFGIAATDAGHVSDVLFTVVQRGKAEFGPLASSIANVFPIAKSLNITFEETAATVTTLTKVFPTTSEAVTGLRNLLGDVVQNMDQFRAAGINVEEVLSKRGITGLMEELNKVTGGNVEVTRKFISSQEGGNAALALMGAQLTTQKENVTAFNTVVGASGGAFTKQQAAVSSAMDRIRASIDRLVQGGGLSTYFQGLLTPVEEWVTHLVTGGEASVTFAQIATSAVGNVASSFGLLLQGSIAVIEG